MGPLASAINFHFSMATVNFRILEYRLPFGHGYYRDDADKQNMDAPYVLDPYLPEDGYLMPRPDRPGWGVEMNMDVLAKDDYVHWERRQPIRPDGSTGYV
jgi:galactonate dehydratase